MARDLGRKQIHHKQNQSAQIVQEQSWSPHAKNDALKLPKGYYVIVRRPRSTFSFEDAYSDVRRQNPGKIFGGAAHNLTHWGWQVQSKPLPTQR